MMFQLRYTDYNTETWCFNYDTE